jgi:inner membrane transporter RhtA
MTPVDLGTARVPPWLLAVGAIFSVQLGAALSVNVIDQVGPAGTAWLRLTFAAIIMVALVRPSLRGLRGHLLALLALGVVTGLMTSAFLAAIERIPLGTVVAIEFLGPLTVASLRSHSVRALVWPLLALVGVVGLTQPWRGDIEPVGIVFAVLAGCGWGTYILLTQRVGDRFAGISGLALTFPVAAMAAAVVGVPQAAGHLTPGVVAATLGLALLVPVLPFALEMLALHRMTAAAFGTLMALEPAVGVTLGIIVLHQKPTATQVAGLVLVVLAGIGAQRGGRRGDRPLASPADSELGFVG